MTDIITTTEAATRYKTSASSVSRAARRAGVGVRRADGRLVGLSERDLKSVFKFLRFKPGNPNFGKKKKRA